MITDPHYYYRSPKFFGVDVSVPKVHESREEYVRKYAAHARTSGTFLGHALIIRGPRGANYLFVGSRVVRDLISLRTCTSVEDMY